MWRRRLVNGEYGDGVPEEKEDTTKKRTPENDDDVDMKEDKQKKKKEESSSDDSDSDGKSDEEGEEESSEEEKRTRKKARKRDQSTPKESRSRRRSHTDHERSDLDQRPSTSSGKRSVKDDPKKRKKMKSEPPLTVTKVMHRLRLKGREGNRKADLIWSKILLMVEDMESQKTIYVKDLNSHRYVNPKTDLPTLDINTVPKFYWSQKMKNYIKCDTYRQMKEQEIMEEIYDEKLFGVTTPTSN